MRFLEFKKYELLVCFSSLAMLCYLVFYGFLGARGFAYRDKLASQLELLKTETAVIVTQHQKIEARVVLLRPESIDPDYLDELARRDLFLVKPSDVIVSLSP